MGCTSSAGAPLPDEARDLVGRWRTSEEKDVEVTDGGASFNDGPVRRIAVRGGKLVLNGWVLAWVTADSAHWTKGGREITWSRDADSTSKGGAGSMDATDFHAGDMCEGDGPDSTPMSAAAHPAAGATKDAQSSPSLDGTSEAADGDTPFGLAGLVSSSRLMHGASGRSLASSVSCESMFGGLFASGAATGSPAGVPRPLASPLGGRTGGPATAPKAPQNLAAKPAGFTATGSRSFSATANSGAKDESRLESLSYITLTEE